MRYCGSGTVFGVALAIGLCAGGPAAAQGTGALASRSVHGKLVMINESVNGVAVQSDDGERMAWQFDKAVIEKIKAFKPGDPVVVIYRLRGSDKAVTAIAFPGAAATPVYFNTLLRAGGPGLHSREQDGGGPGLPHPLLRVAGRPSRRRSLGACLEA